MRKVVGSTVQRLQYVPARATTASIYERATVAARATHCTHQNTHVSVFAHPVRRANWEECNTCFDNRDSEWTCPAAQKVYNDYLNSSQPSAADIVELNHGGGKLVKVCAGTIVPYKNRETMGFFAVGARGVSRAQGGGIAVCSKMNCRSICRCCCIIQWLFRVVSFDARSRL